MGRVSKGVKCSVVGCDQPAVRSLSSDKVIRAGLNVERGRRAYLCREHYKEYKRRTKNERRIERWRYKP
ncbi:MAG: hypothetical protein DRN03_01630 [Thermoplasmata archaeon]|nr:MAG: hypothetical protein DRN03_01630 [Thermoplasmata archaeon]HDI42303.1 hypothetical protein [Candidatus Bathyarchaeota archaeon]